MLRLETRRVNATKQAPQFEENNPDSFAGNFLSSPIVLTISAGLTLLMTVLIICACIKYLRK